MANNNPSVVLDVVAASVFKAKSNGKTWTKLWCPLGLDMCPIMVAGDRAYLAGTQGVTFTLTCRDQKVGFYLDFSQYEDASNDSGTNS